MYYTTGSNGQTCQAHDKVKQEQKALPIDMKVPFFDFTNPTF